MEINVYDKKGKVTKTCEALTIDIMFGTVRSLMKLFRIEDVSDTAELMKVIYSAWEELTEILSEIFPEMTEEDWNGVKISELLPVVVDVLKSSFFEILKISGDAKN